MSPPTPLGRAFINRFQGGFPLCQRPFREAATALGSDALTRVELATGASSETDRE